MATSKKRTTKRAGGESSQSPVSHVTTRAELIARIAEASKAAGPKPKRRVDPRVGRKRNHGDGIDDFELALLRHGVNFEDLARAARAYTAGTHTQLNKVCHAVLQWWCSLPMGPRRVLWVDPSSGYTERNVPKFSTVEGIQLMQRGLAGARWVYTRAHLLEAREWRARMLAMTPEQRLASPPEMGDERPA